MDDKEMLLYLIQLRRSKKPERTSGYNCEKCSTELLVDSKEYYNVCPSCGLCYPYRDHVTLGRRSPPYKRKWHFMTVLRRNNLALGSRELQNMMSLFLKLDNKYSILFPGENVMNMNFLLKIIADSFGLAHLSSKIELKYVKPATLQKWVDRFNLVMST